MLRPPSWAVACAFFALLLGAGSLRAQDQLSDLQRQFAAERDQLIQAKAGKVEFDDVKALAEKQAKVLAKWLDAHPDSPDAIDGRLMLTNIYMDVGQHDTAKQVLGAIDPAKASALQLATAADMAQGLGMDEQRNAWIDAAVGKDAPLEERMALATFLMTRLVEIEKGEAIFTAATAAAKSDEERAEIAFYRATAISRREDLPDGSYEKALDGLAKAFPDTYWGSVAKDRLAALAMEVGSPAIEIEEPTLDGGTLSLASLKGKVVLLDFWNAASVRDPRVPNVLKDLEKEYGEQGLQIVGINLDTDAELAKTAAKERGMDWPQMFDGKGWKSDAALRYAVESVPYQILIDADGKIAALRVFLLDDYGVKDLKDAIGTALARRKG